MRQEKITGLPIVMGKRLIGLVSMDDIIQALDKGTSRRRHKTI